MAKVRLGRAFPVWLVDVLIASAIGYIAVSIVSLVRLQLPLDSNPVLAAPHARQATGYEGEAPDRRQPIAVVATPRAGDAIRFSSPAPHAKPAERKKANTKVAVIVPFRNRPEQLAQFAPNIDAFLSRQNIEFSVFVVEQLGSARFNRGALLNVGFLEAGELANASRRPFDCIVIHDIDLIPVERKNSYDCLKNPLLKAIQLSTAIDLYSWGLPDAADGGVTLLQMDAFRKANGYSNRYYGWGGEDNDLKARLSVWDVNMTRVSTWVGRYVTLKEGHFRSNRTAEDRYLLLRLSARLLHEGLGTVKYRLVRRTVRPLYTLVSVELWVHEDAEIVKRKGMSLSGSLEALVSLVTSCPRPAV